MWLQFREHLGFLMGGTATGAFAAVGIVRLVSSQLYGLSQAEVSVFTTGAAAFSFSFGAVAVIMSARRAAVADPAILLRHQ